MLEMRLVRIKLLLNRHCYIRATFLPSIMVG